MKYRSVFDIIGPVMIGPSSSHTAGAARIGRAARRLFGRKPDRVLVTLYGSFAKTYRGHGTDIALIGGVLDFDTFDKRIVKSLEIAREQGIRVEFRESEEVPEHPNTVRLRLEDGRGAMEVVGVSIGGGKMEIVELNGFELKMTGNSPTLLVPHQDRYGAIAAVAGVLARHRINIGYMQVSRKEKGSEALMIIETDQPVEQEVLDEIAAQPGIEGATLFA
ncbi:L-serine dehydratase [Planifilum fulgidum]|jgi:L-serine dehydratase|uniref:L-serine deaminase n=1 Tax=Planifilum fulgidum TaxID=201973 RepID=A0A1I2R9J2_9BACL|nr:L-serine ammonia-lyase, iron-sulfur-dependent subunit beta [Planifilum fulgidum]MBO2496799.1 L-serine ammonia-lyase, iron-sulfur-dependent, subunit beta [Bacillota bacterium]MBO2532309.1 L-serine ammonia-lyase, iron-sulfur-dependent, subunit beta [Thermoactinomycetaceae bacterium]SFG35257.1 L-serine dehydratase [Planifilum fulgidum]